MELEDYRLKLINILHLRPNLLKTAKELEEKIIQIVKKLGEKGSSMNFTTIRPLIKSVIKYKDMYFYI